MRFQRHRPLLYTENLYLRLVAFAYPYLVRAAFAQYAPGVTHRHTRSSRR